MRKTADARMEGGTASVACRSPHAGFHGSIKNSAQDFVVTEIDVQGQLVNSPGALEEPVKNKAGIREFVHRDSVRVKLSEETPSSEVTCDAGNLNSGEGLSQEGLDLSVILSCSVNKTLEQFASTVQGCSEVQKNLEMSLGAFPDKHQRAIVHSAVKSSYPFLMTVTNREEILVREDPDFRALSKLVSVEEAEDFFRFKDAKVPGSTFTFLPDDIKEHRTSVHHFVSRKFGKLMETKSFMTQGRTAITVRLRERGRQDRKRTAADRDEQDIYTGFTLRKENLETLEAISYMAAVLGVLPSDFSYAGIKDKRAVTYQSMVVKKISPERLLAKAYMFERKGIQLSKIRPVSEPLRLGRLAGNHFDLVVRDLKPHKSSSVDLESLVKEAVENVKTRGFVNYYGPQRFGSSQKVQADQVGLALLKEDMNTALRLFLSPEEGDDLENKAKQHFHQTGNAKESLALMPLHKARERLMLRALHRYGSGPEGGNQAWLSLPHSMRVFYLHAYCSRLWNEAACFRLQTLGPRPVQGDLVSAAACRDSQAEEETHASQVHVVTAAEEHDGVFSLDQVVLPMPGNSVKYPENAVGLWYQDRLGQDGLGSCRFRIPSLKLNVPGCYRPLLSYPRNVSYSLHIDEDTQDTGLSAPPSRTSLALSFNLNASCYATVCLREIMKCEL
ncbi:pseudouridylate synthase PUS7L isoform X3 [Pangasianodon hypophthalmus]|uniref:pseudouridylate synthase PUS7L isoform X3 n=1 Tax=Pangasianodon hypophthalmus TaxID=310915 RepID=UPI0023079027|nr:pseudouridylate synthase PUS7L isoform X3 [Pangasianodon hypophthalmus]